MIVSLDITEHTQFVRRLLRKQDIFLETKSVTRETRDYDVNRINSACIETQTVLDKPLASSKNKKLLATHHTTYAEKNTHNATTASQNKRRK